MDDSTLASAAEPLVAVPAFDERLADDDSVAWCAGVIVDALDQLPRDQREVVTMAYLEGRTLRDVAAQLGIPEGTAKSRARLGLAHVRAMVGRDVRAGR